jgi:hypothetical protein
VSLAADKSGYLGASQLPPIPEQQAQAEVQMADGGPKEITLKLLRHAAIEGTARDAKGGSVAAVRLFRRTGAGDPAFQRDIQVDRTGEFRFAPLGPGRYYLEVATASTTNRPGGTTLPLFERNYYGGASGLESAKPIDLVAGQTAHIDIELRPAKRYQIQGRIAGNAEYPIFNLTDTVNSLPVGHERWDAETQTFRLYDIPPGSYRLEAIWHVDGKEIRASIPVTVTTSNVDSLVVGPETNRR